MTNRDWIKDMQRIPQAMAPYLQPHFHLFDVTTVPVIIKPLLSYGQPTKACCDGPRIYFDTVYFSTCKTGSFLQYCAHELTHVEQYRRDGWWAWLRNTTTTIWRSIKRWKLYDHSLSLDEQEAMARAHAVYESLATQSGWQDLLDARMQ